MSRATKRKRKIERAKQSTGNMPSYSNNAIQQQIAQLIAKTQSGPNNILYSPGIPLQTQPGVNPDGQPRQWSFPIAINTSGVNRTMGNPDIPSFQQLRMLAKMYSGITLPERVWLDMVHGLKLTIGLRPELKAEGMNDSDPEIQKIISKILTFFEKPDKVHDLHSWLKMMIRDQTQIDEMYLYKRRTRGGELYALEVVAGDSVKPLLDDWGRVPEPPLAAYQQFPWGIPGEMYTTEDLIHYQETPQSDMPYGFGRVERFMMEVNQALRKKKRDLAMFTEGNIPTGIMEVPADSVWTTDQIEAYEQLWNALIAGNVQQQVRIKFTQPGMKYVPTDKGDILTDFDYFLYKISCGVYGISLADIGFVEDIHKSSDQGQQNMMYRRTLFPIVSVYAHNIITSIIRDEFHEDRLEASFTGYEEETDFNTQAAGFQILANIGAIAPSDIAHKMGLPDVPKTGPFILGKGGPIWLKDYEEGSQLRTLQTQSQVAGLQFAAQNPGGPPKPQEGEESDDSTQQGKEGKAGTGTAKDDKPSSGGKAEEGDKSGEGKGKTTGVPKGDAAKSNSTDNTSEKRDTKDSNLKRAVDSEPAHTGMMIAFMLDPTTAQQLALEGGEDPDDMHVMLAYLGKIDDVRQGYSNPYDRREMITTVLKAFAQSAHPLEGNIGGLGRFTPSESSDNMSPVIALVNAQGLQDFRRRLVDVVETAGYWVASDFDYTPHCTLAYVPADDPMPVESIPNFPLKFDRLCLAIADGRHFFPLGKEVDDDANIFIHNSIGVNSLGEENGQSREDTQRATCTTIDGIATIEQIDTRVAGLSISSSTHSDGTHNKEDNSKRAELRRWRTRAVSDIERGRSIRPFESNIIPAQERDAIRAELDRCSTPDEVRAVFHASQERVTSFFVNM